jgi:hypothetical protein
VYLLWGNIFPFGRRPLDRGKKRGSALARLMDV